MSISPILLILILVVFKVTDYITARIVAREEVDSYHIDVMTQVIEPFAQVADERIAVLEAKIVELEKRLEPSKLGTDAQATV